MKTLGQIAYEADPEGGQQNWGPWEKAPSIVRGIHKNMAQAVANHVLVELVKKIQEDFSYGTLVEFWDKIQEGYCRDCGANTSKNGECYCRRDV